MINRRIIENGSIKIRTKTNENCITPEQANQLKKVVDELYPNVEQKPLNFGKKKIKANGCYVGVIGTTDCTLEILPKIDAKGSGRQKNENIRKRFIQMLAYSLDIDAGSITNLKWEQNPILEFFISTFVEKLLLLVRHGLPKSYQFFEDDLTKVRGSLNVVRQFTSNLVNPSKIACQFDELSNDIVLNQKMKATIKLLYIHTKCAENKKKLRHLLLLYFDISDIQLSIIRKEKVSLDRTNSNWHWILKLADLLLASMFQTTFGGTNSGYSFLFDMSKLFEDYIGKKLKNVAKRNAIVVKTQSEGMEYLDFIDNISGRKQFGTKIIPDIVESSDDGTVHIIDTKWKHLKYNKSDDKLNVSQRDIYQMLSYGLLHNARKMTILYPHSSKFKNYGGIQVYGKINVPDKTLYVSTIDISDSKKEEEQLEKLLFRNLPQK